MNEAQGRPLLCSCTGHAGHKPLTTGSSSGCRQSQIGQHVCVTTISHAGQIDHVQIDHLQIEHLGPDLPLSLCGGSV